jgi:hypothetical protein
MVDVKIAEVKPVEAAIPPPSAAAAPKVEPARTRVDEVQALATQRIKGGDILGARAILLQAPETATSGQLAFMLAETYDPNMLASWQARGITANPEHARQHYRRARELGDNRAQTRLDWLTGN